jgi:hypothetical protein
MNARQRLVIEAWAPEYGTSTAIDDTEPADATIDAGIEVAPERWQPHRPSPPAAQPVLVFVDGVRRIDAHGFIVDDGSPVPRHVLLASYAAGAVRANGNRAETVAVDVRRGLFGRDPLPELDTRAGTFTACAVTADTPDALSQALQQQLGQAEIDVTSRVDGADLTVVDGPLYGRQHLPATVGYIKSHRVQYLPPELLATVAQLAPGERTPLFLFRTSWTRYSWYLRLPGPAPHAWSGIVRLEAADNAALAQVVAIADLTAALLPGFASAPHKDPRAPQNLYPIGGLERELRRRLGDPALVTRLLRQAA